VRQEMGGAPLGDERLSDRLVEITQAKSEKPGCAYTQAADGDRAGIKGYYRFIDNPDNDALSMEHILEPHRQCTIRRMQGQRTVLCIQDGSDLNYTSLSYCKDLGVIGTNQTGTQSLGLHLHSTFAVSSSGLPLGIVRAECFAPRLKSQDDKRQSHEIPIEEKETFSWVAGLRDMVKVAAQMPQTRIISACDREADFFELFEEQQRNPVVDLLVRAKHNRTIKHESGRVDKLFDSVSQSTLQGMVSVKIPRQSARPKLSKTKAKEKQPSRKALLEVRFQQVELLPPNYYSDKSPITVYVIHAVESNPPEGCKSVEWFLLTTIEIKSADDAFLCLRWYCLRWRIEDFHRVLKSGCRVEQIAHETAERIRRAVAINLVIAWRIMLMTLLGRVTPNLPPNVLFSDIELLVIKAYAKKNGYLYLKHCMTQ